MSGTVVVEYLYVEPAQRLVITLDDFSTALQQLGVALELYQPDTGHNVCHVAFVSRRNDVVLPGSQLRFGQGVLTLAMQRKELELFVKPFVVDAGNITPRKGPAFGRSEVFNGMEGERGEIGDFAADPARTFCSESVGGIRKNDDPAEGLPPHSPGGCLASR